MTLKKSNEKYFKTYDLALAAALVAAGFFIDNIDKPSYGKSSFIFLRSAALDEVVKDYWADKQQVNPKAYFDILKHLKTRIYSG